MSNPFDNIPKLQAPERRGYGGDENIEKSLDRESVSDSEREDPEQDARRSPVPKAKATTTRERNTDPFADYEANPPQPKYAEMALQTMQSAVREVDLPDNPEDALKRLDELRSKEAAGWISSQPFREKNEYLRSKLNEFQKLREVQKEISDFDELQKQVSELQQQNSDLQKQDAEWQKQVSELQQQNSDLQKQDAEWQKQDAEWQKQVFQLRKQNSDLQKQAAVQQKQKQDVGHQDQAVELRKQLDEATTALSELEKCLKRTRNQRDRLNVMDDEHFEEAERLAQLCRDNGINPYPQTRMQRTQERDRARRAAPAPLPAPPPAPPRPTSSRMRRGSSEQSLTSNLSRARLSDAMDLDPPVNTPRSTTRVSQRGSPAKRVSEGPEKEQRPQKDRRVSSSSMSRTMQSLDLPLEEAEASLSLARLLMPDGSHRPLSDLDEDRMQALETSWDTFTSKTEPFRRWWALMGSKNQCCGGKIISRMDADREEGRFACKTCPKSKPPRPCLRLTTPVSEDGQRLTRLVEVMPEKGKDGLHAFEYF
ncbi:hypothetical protein KC323_g7788 [Hortaea werneckii]|nr:hypothetical protein KC323_g7788 [Hortaea werneckii]